MQPDLFVAHPLPWKMSTEWFDWMGDTPHNSPGDAVITDANGDEVLGCSEWLSGDRRALVAMVDAINNGGRDATGL